MSSDQGQVDDALGGAHRLVALVDPHGPPEGSRPGLVDATGQVQDRRRLQAGFRSGRLDAERGHVGPELVEDLRGTLDETPVDPAFLMRMLASAYSRVRSDFGLMARWMLAASALGPPGSMTTMVGLCGFIFTRFHMMGWAITGFAHENQRSDSSKSL
jgi:hypothetical protein